MAADVATEEPPQTAQAPAVAAEPAPPPAAGGGAAPTSEQPKGAGTGKGAKQAKGSKGPKEAKKAKDAGDEPGGDGPSVAAHPRAARGVARAKGWGGLIGFLAGGYMSLPTNTVAAAGLRALAAGVICYLVVWAGAVFVWRRLVMLEIKSREQQLLAAYTGRARRELAAGVGDRSGARAPT